MSQQRVIFFSPFAGIWLHAMPEALVAAELRRARTDVTYVTCDGILAALEEARAGGYLDEPEPTAASEQCPIDRRLVGDEADVGYGDECFLLLEGAPGPSPSAGERTRRSGTAMLSTTWRRSCD